MGKTIEDNEVDMVIWKTAVQSRVIALGALQDATAQKGTAIAFGDKRNAVVSGSVGYAVALGGGEARAQTAVSMSSSGGTAVSDRLAVALNHLGVAIGREIAFAENLDSQAHSDKLAIAVGPRGLADGLFSISLGIEGLVVARAGGTIALAFYDTQPGHWGAAHGSDPYWSEGEQYLRELKVAKVGEQGIRPDFVYQLDREGAFIEMGPADPRKGTATTA